MLSSCIAIYDYLLYGSRFFPSDAADSADTLRAPGYSSKGTCEDKGPFGSGKPSFALFSKYFNSDIVYN